MSWIDETVSAISAAVKLLLHDRNALMDFNNTQEGFWRSFSAIILIMPLYLFIANINWPTGTNEPAPEVGHFVHLINLLLQWAIWPLIMVFVARRLGLGQNYSLYVIAYNWANVVLITVLGLPAMLYTIGLISIEVATLLTGFLQIGSLYLEWYLTRVALDTNGLLAAAIVLGNFVLSLGIVRIIS